MLTPPDQPEKNDRPSDGSHGRTGDGSGVRPLSRRDFLARSTIASIGAIVGTACSSGAAPSGPAQPPEGELPTIEPASLSIEPPFFSIEQGRAFRLAAILRRGSRPPAGVGVEWSSLDPALASVGRNGVVRVAPDREGETVIVARFGGRRAEARVRVVPLGESAVHARALAATVGNEHISLLLDAGTGLVLDENGRILEWQDARGSDFPAARPAEAAPTVGRTPDGAASVRFDGIGQGLRTDAHFELDSVGHTPGLVYVGTTWGNGIPAIVGDDELPMSLGLTLVPEPRRLWGRDGLVLGTSSGHVTQVANGPGDRQKSTRVRVHDVRLWRNILYTRSPVVHLRPTEAQQGSGTHPLYIGRSPSGQFDADDVCAVLVMRDFAYGAQYERIVAWARERHGAVSGAPRLVLFMGDSLTNGLDLPDSRYSYPNQLMERPSFRAWDDLNVARGGTGVVQQLITAEQDVDFYYDPARDRNVFVLMTGSNDLAFLNRTGAQAYEDTRTYCLGRRAKGWQVVVLSMMSRNAGERFERERQSYNALLRADHSFADRFVDVAADPRIGAPTAHADRVWFQDGVHPTREGYRVIADLVEPVLLSL